MEKLKKFTLISIIVLICVIARESGAQNSRSIRKKPNGNNKTAGFNHRINQDPNNGLSQQHSKRPGFGQRRRTKGSHQRQDHG